VEHVDRLKFLGVQIRRLKKFAMGPHILKRFYSCTIESILTGCITAWYGNTAPLDLMALQRVVRTAQTLPGAELPAIQDLYIRKCEKKARKIVKDQTIFSLATRQEVPGASLSSTGS
jgi:gmma-aminobutyric acid receptor subunit gamma